MLGRMDGLVLLFVAGLAILLGWVTSVAIGRGRSLERLEDATGAAGADDVERAVRQALQDGEDARWLASQTSHDIHYLTELLSSGVVRLRDDLTVEWANDAAHLMLDRKPGSMNAR